MLLGGSFRPRCVCAPSAARRAALFATESVLCLTDVRRSAGGRPHVVGWTKMRTAQLYTWNAASLRAQEAQAAAPMVFWLVPLTLHPRTFHGRAARETRKGERILRLLYTAARLPPRHIVKTTEPVQI